MMSFIVENRNGQMERNLPFREEIVETLLSLQGLFNPKDVSVNDINVTKEKFYTIEIEAEFYGTSNLNWRKLDGNIEVILG